MLQLPTETPDARAANRARHLARLRRDRLELWRIRGATAKALRQPRQAPLMPRSMAPEIREVKAAAWLAGYDGR